MLNASMNPAPAAEPTGPTGVCGVLAGVVSRWPDRVAVSDGTDSLTYRELDRRSAALAERLRAAGARRGVLVGVCADRGVGLIVALVAALRTGAGYVPLDPGYPGERLRLTVQDAQCVAVAAPGRLAQELAGAAGAFVDLDEPLPGADARAPGTDRGEGGGEVPFAGCARVAGQDTAYVIYTSGSTGRPKGVRVSHDNLLRLFTTSAGLFGFDEHGVWSMFHSAAFDFSVWEIYGALLHGGRVHVIPYATTRDPDAVWRLVRDEGITMLSQTPTAFAHLTHAAARAGHPPTSLRHVVFGGEALNPAQLAEWAAHYGTDTPELVNMYGITETTVHVTHHRVTDADIHDPHPQGSPIGTPLPDLTLHLLDEHLDPVEDLTVAEIYVSGPGVAQGYLDRPALTAGRFLPDPHRPGGRLYRSGDLAHRTPDGRYHHHGRSDHQIKLRGFRIEPGEIERTLLAHPFVHAAAVTLDRTDPGHPQLAAYTVLADATPATGATHKELHDHLAQHLPPHMIPSTITALPALPTTPNGKLDTAQLPPPTRTWQDAGPADGPRDDIEASIAELFTEVLGVQRIGIHDGFFDIGGDSLLAIRLMARVRRVFGLRLQVRALLEAPTVARLAAVVTETLVAEMDPAELEALLSAEEEHADGSHDTAPEKRTA
ncbi:amino acid adenylation domain-containing protein [Streptomyces venezuelae]|uniref:amino acid adenylation domain-containing protein n=1 Tax=Streptomyces venezuelae TaxID=54571 RepID=UPI00379B2D32